MINDKFYDSKYRGEIIVIIAYGVIVISAVLYVIRYILKFKENFLRQTIQRDKELIAILDKLDQNICIMKKQDGKLSFDYVNQRFLDDFKEQIQTLSINSEPSS